ncbi:MAG: hypothetical protein H8D94_01490 [Candidatus Pelagibacter sp.]|nr:hypothetical protein [Candidatus Pelagibacter sp.]
MKKSELRTQIRKIVREEVAMAIQEVITEMKEPVIEEQPEQPKRKKVVKEKQHFTSNSVLNDVLNETVNDDSGWETLGGGTQTSQNMNNILKSQYGDMMNGGSNVPLPQTDTEGRPVDVNNISDDLMNNLTKDYSKTLKAMEKSANNSRGV